MTNEEAIIQLKQAVACCLDDDKEAKLNEAIRMGAKALETLQHIDTVLNGTLEVHGFPTSMIQEDVFRYKAIIRIMKDFDEWQKLRNEK